MTTPGGAFLGISEIPLTWRPDLGDASTVTLYVAYKEGFKADASLTLRRDDGRLALRAFGRNLSNEYVVSVANVDVPLTGLVGTGLPVSPIPSDELVYSGRPREIGVEISVAF